MMKRREFLNSTLQSTALALGGMFCPLNLFAQPQNRLEQSPHFFLQIYINQGWDPIYLLDSRPLSMTAADLVQNYSALAPVQWQDDRGETCWVSPIAAGPLSQFRDRMAIVNGVLMSTDFDGHKQNRDYFFTGNAFGGPHFGAQMGSHLSERSKQAIDHLRVDSAGEAQGGMIVSVRADSGFRLAELASSSRKEFKDAYSYLESHTRQIAEGSGLSSVGLTRLADSLTNSDLARSRLMELKAKDFAKSPVQRSQQNTHLIMQAFKNGITRSATFWINRDCDTHAANQAQEQPAMYRNIVSQIEAIVTLLHKTPYDSKQSFLDLTTICIGSEFSRTMKQAGKSVDQTGTDHNTLSGQVLLLGKGIRGNRIIGASDFQLETEALSPAHMSLDPKKIKVMGRPFDFTTQVPSMERPAEYRRGDYLTIESVVNSLYRQFGVPRSFWRESAGKIAPIISALQG